MAAGVVEPRGHGPGLGFAFVVGIEALALGHQQERFVDHALLRIGKRVVVQVRLRLGDARLVQLGFVGEECCFDHDIHRVSKVHQIASLEGFVSVGDVEVQPLRRRHRDDVVGQLIQNDNLHGTAAVRVFPRSLGGSRQISKGHVPRQALLVPLFLGTQFGRGFRRNFFR